MGDLQVAEAEGTTWPERPHRAWEVVGLGAPGAALEPCASPCTQSGHQGELRPYLGAPNWSWFFGGNPFAGTGGRGWGEGGEGQRLFLILSPNKQQKSIFQQVASGGQTLVPSGRWFLLPQ